MIPWWSVDFGEEAQLAVLTALQDRHVSQGPVVQELERSLATLLNVEHVIAVSSGTMALTLALTSLGIGRGDEVLLPNRSWIASAHAVLSVGAIPQFVDTQPDVPVMDVTDIESRVTKKTKAIMPVYMNGRAVDLRSLSRIARHYNLHIIEDAAQALGSRDEYGDWLGTKGDVSCFSLSVAKVISSGQGGFVATRNPLLAESIRRSRTHGVENVHEIRQWQQPGVNARMSDVLASIGLSQLKRLDERIDRLNAVFDLYWRHLSRGVSIRMLPRQHYQTPPYVELLARNRGELALHLSNHGIETRAFYPDLDTAPYFNLDPTLTNCRHFAAHGLYLPSGPSITDEQIDHVIQAVMEFDQSATG